MYPSSARNRYVKRKKMSFIFVYTSNLSCHPAHMCDMVQKWTFFLYHVENEVELGVCVCVCVWIWMWVGLPEWSKKKKKGKKGFSFSWDIRLLGERPWQPLSLVLTSCPWKIKQVDFLVPINFRFLAWGRIANIFINSFIISGRTCAGI